MQLQSLFDSVCRCFGHPGEPGYDPAHRGDDLVEPDHVAANPNDDGGSSSHSRRRNVANRLGLKDKVWDELFADGKDSSRRDRARGRGEGSSDQAGPESSAHSRSASAEARAVAEAKLAAAPTRQRHKRRRSSNDIFRKKKLAAQIETSYRETVSPQPNAFSRLLNPSLALCFATPVRETNDETGMDATQSIDNSDTNTLNTCEDTITSTVCFDAKYSHIVETRPPMPLFNQFKIGHEEDEIRQVIATDSHSSLRMIKLLQEAQREEQQQQQQIKLKQKQRRGARGSSSDSEDLPPVLSNGGNRMSSSSRGQGQPSSCPPISNDDDDGIPGVKAVSSSTDSSKQTVSSARTSSSGRPRKPSP